MLGVLSVTLNTNEAQILQTSKEIEENNLDNLIDELKNMQLNINTLLTNMVNRGDDKTKNELLEIGNDDEDDQDSENDGVTPEEKPSVNKTTINHKKNKDENRNSKKRKTRH